MMTKRAHLGASARALGLTLGITLVACGRPDSGRTEEPDPQPVGVETNIEAAAGGLARSIDGLFVVSVPAGGLTADGSVTITRVTVVPNPDATVSGFYDVKLSAGIDITPGQSLELEFKIAPSVAADVGETNLRIAVRDSASGPYTDYLSGAYLSWKESLTAPTVIVGSFAAVDYSSIGVPCACDTGPGCQWQCACDTGCTMMGDANGPSGDSNGGCTASEFTCNDGGCIDRAFECDNVPDCADASDEDAHCTAGGDIYEPDGSVTLAKDLIPGITQTRSIHLAGNEDYAKFELTDWSDVLLETDGPSGDTTMTLYDASQTQIEYDDDDGNGSFSLINRTQLGAGTYFVKVADWGNNGVIDSYTLSLTVTPSGPPLMVPTGLTATHALGVITVSWDPVMDATGYRLYYDEDQYNPPYTPTYAATEGTSPLDVMGTTVDLHGLPANATYYFAIAALDAFGESMLSAPDVTLFVPVEADPYEDDDSFAMARAIEPGEPQTHSIDVAGDQDYVTFVLTGPADIVLETSGPTGDTVLHLYDSAQMQLAEDDQGGDGSFSKITQMGLGASTYYAMVRGFYTSGTSAIISVYDLTLTVGTAIPAPTGLMATGGDGEVTVSWSPVTGAASYKVFYDQDMGEPYSPSPVAVEGDSPVETTNTTITLTGLTNGDPIYVAVQAFNGITDTVYSTEVSATPVGVPDPYEDDDTLMTAQAIVFPEVQTRSLHDKGDLDFAQFVLVRRSDVTVETDGTAGDTVVEIQDDMGMVLSSDDNGGNGNFSRLTASGLSAGTYYIRVAEKSDMRTITSYTLSLDVVEAPDAPAGVMAVAGTGEVTVSWNAVMGASAYRLHYDDDDGMNPPYGAVFAMEGASPVNTTNLTLTLTGLPQEPLFFAVTALNGTIESDYSTEVSATPQ